MRTSAKPRVPAYAIPGSQYYNIQDRYIGIPRAAAGLLVVVVHSPVNAPPSSVIDAGRVKRRSAPSSSSVERSKIMFIIAR